MGAVRGSRARVLGTLGARQEFGLGLVCPPGDSGARRAWRSWFDLMRSCGASPKDPATLIANSDYFGRRYRVKGFVRGRSG